MARSEQGRRFVAVGLLGALVLAAGGAVMGLSLAPEPLPASLKPGPEVTAVPVTYESFDDLRQISFVLEQGASDSILLAATGTVTSLKCEIGAPLASGDVPLSLDSSPVAALHTAYPLWRDLQSGDKGPDVAAVQAELGRLGYRAGSSSVMDWTTTRALKAFFGDRGYTSPDGSLSRAAILWLPSPELVVADCPLELGQAVDAGQAVVTTGGGLTALRPAQLPEGLAPGARTVTFGDSSAPADANGLVTDPSFLAVLAASPDYAFATLQENEETAPQMTLSSALATPLETAVVPAGALFRVSGASGCVSSDGTGLPVTIVSSRLGSTYVVIDDGSTPTTVDLQAPADRTGRAGTCS